MKKEIILTATYNRGYGLWTGICVFFCSIFGLKSKAAKKKADQMANFLRNEIMNQAHDAKATNIRDLRIVWTNGFSGMASAIADIETNKQKDAIAPNQKIKCSDNCACEEEDFIDYKTVLSKTNPLGNFTLEEKEKLKKEMLNELVHKDNEDRWMCSCGYKNRNNVLKCFRCGKEKPGK